MEENREVMDELEKRHEESMESDICVVEDPVDELMDMAEKECDEPERSSGALWMAAGAAIVVGSYVGGKWLWKKAKKGIEKIKEKSKERSQEAVRDEDLNEDDIVDADCEDEESTSDDKEK